MSTLNSLLKKRAALEAKILDAQRLEKRRAEILDLLQKHDLLHLSNEQIIAALTPQPATAQPIAAATYTTTTGAQDDDYQ